MPNLGEPGLGGQNLGRPGLGRHMVEGLSDESQLLSRPNISPQRKRGRKKQNWCKVNLIFFNVIFNQNGSSILQFFCCVKHSVE